MFSVCMVLGIVLATLFLPLLAAPLRAENNDTGVIQIPLTEINPHIDRKGYVNKDLLLAHIEYATRKYRCGTSDDEICNSSNFHSNTTDTYTRLSQRALFGQAQLSPAGPLGFHGLVKIGSRGEQFRIMFDTGSADFFVAGAVCRGPGCEGHKPFDPRRSSKTARQVTPVQEYSLGFDSGKDADAVEVNLWTDTVTIGDVTSPQQSFGLAHVMGPSFSYGMSPGDGIMGFAFPRLSKFGPNHLPFFHKLVQKKAIYRPVLGFRFIMTGSDAHLGPQLTLGALNPLSYQGSIQWIPLTQAAWWQVPIKAIYVSDTPVVSKPVPSWLDTGTTHVIGDLLNVAKIYGAIKGARPIGNSGVPGAADKTMWTIPCDNQVSVQVQYGNIRYPIIPRLFNTGKVPNSANECYGAIVGSKYIQTWIVGVAFMRNVFTGFDCENAQVGFAQLA